MTRISSKTNENSYPNSPFTSTGYIHNMTHSPTQQTIDEMSYNYKLKSYYRNTDMTNGININEESMEMIVDIDVPELPVEGMFSTINFQDFIGFNNNS